eukprot:3197635-Lingulodinium_polyedra.AAC.1
MDGLAICLLPAERLEIVVQQLLHNLLCVAPGHLAALLQHLARQGLANNLGCAAGGHRGTFA